MSHTFHTQKHIEDLLRGAAVGAPQLPLRKKALRNALVRRICHQPSPYAGFIRMVVPVVMLMVIVFFGQPTPNDPTVAVILTQSQQAIKSLPKEDRVAIANTLGVDPVSLLRAAARAADVSVVEPSGPDSFSLQETTFMARAAPAPSRMMKGVPDEQPVMALYQAESNDSISQASAIYQPPLTTIRFTNTDGALVEIVFDERFIPISQTVIRL